MAKVFIGIGSNIDKHIHVPQVVNELQEILSEVEISPVYQTSAVGFEGADFFNLVIAGDTELTPSEVYQFLRELETRHQRIRNSNNKFVSRTLDLDLLLYDDLQINDGSIRIPNDDITRYAFVLKPLADIAGERLHPVYQIPFNILWGNFANQSIDMQVIPLSEIKQLRPREA